jgi:hypothetical protein
MGTDDISRYMAVHDAMMTVYGSTCGTGTYRYVCSQNSWLSCWICAGNFGAARQPEAESAVFEDTAGRYTDACTNWFIHCLAPLCPGRPWQALPIWWGGRVRLLPPPLPPPPMGPVSVPEISLLLLRRGCQGCAVMLVQ